MAVLLSWTSEGTTSLPLMQLAIVICIGQSLFRSWPHRTSQEDTDSTPGGILSDLGSRREIRFVEGVEEFYNALLAPDLRLLPVAHFVSRDRDTPDA
jgi:hypothetical protein